MKRKTKRSRAKHPALDPKYSPKTRFEEISDYDYLHKLTEKELDFLNSFNEEWINADMKHPGKKLHKTKKKKRECYARNNSRNRDIINVSKAKGNTPVSLESLRDIPLDQEEMMNLNYDAKYNKEELKKLFNFDNSENNGTNSTKKTKD